MKSLKSQVPSLKNPEISSRHPSSAVHSIPSLPSIPSKSAGFAFLSASLAFLLSGCATEKIAESLTTKNVSGNGTVIESHIGINTDTKIPEIKTLFIDGDIATVKAGTNAVSYREESSSSVWNV